MQKIIDRYNKGQHKYNTLDINIIVKNEIATVMVKLEVIGLSASSNTEMYIGLYDFLIDHQFGWLDTFHKDPEWQDDFWQWMDNELHGAQEENRNILWDINGIGDSHPIEPTKQMSVGYILEFIQDQIKEE